MHVTWLVGGATLLAKAPDAWRGTLLAVSQPAEETGEGAGEDRRRAVYALPQAQGDSRAARDAAAGRARQLSARDHAVDGGQHAGDHFPLTTNDPGETCHVAAALRGLFGSDRVEELADPLSVSEDFGSFGSEWDVPSVFLYVGGTDPGLYRRAQQAGRVTEDVPTNHSSRFTPVLHPTLEAGVQTITTASLSYLGRDSLRA
jgi:metal-dependent amidase/aminoacylase/carboxypeptidase family protein